MNLILNNVSNVKILARQSQVMQSQVATLSAVDEFAFFKRFETQASHVLAQVSNANFEISLPIDCPRYEHQSQSLLKTAYRGLSSTGYCWRSRRSAYVAGLRAANREVGV